MIRPSRAGRTVALMAVLALAARASAGAPDPSATSAPVVSGAGATSGAIGPKAPTPSPTPSASPPTPSLAPATLPPATLAPATLPPVTLPPATGLPACAHADIPSAHAGLDEWQRTLLDTSFTVGPAYAPGDLVDTGSLGMNGGFLVRSMVAADLAALAADARAAGVPLVVASAYRDHATQAATFDYWVSVGGYEQALLTSARAGHSEHQLGTALDLTDASGAAPWGYPDWAATPTGAWLRDNGWRYGFVMSYPAGATDRTCYSYEPWHYRYVGRDMAAEILIAGLTTREYLWPRQ